MLTIIIASWAFLGCVAVVKVTQKRRDAYWKAREVQLAKTLRAYYKHGLQSHPMPKVAISKASGIVDVSLEDVELELYNARWIERL